MIKSNSTKEAEDQLSQPEAQKQLRDIYENKPAFQMQT